MSRPRKTKPAAASNPGRVRDAIRFAPNPIPTLTPVNLASYLDSFCRGYLREAAILWNSIQWRDDRVGADAGKRHKTTPRYGYNIVPAEGQDPKAAAVQRHVEAIKFALDNLTARDVLDASVRGGVSMMARQQMRAVGFQWQVHELVWRTLPGGLTLDAISMPLWWFERTTGSLRYLPSDLALEGAELESDGWMVTRGDGLMAATCVLYLLRRMALTDWTLYNGRVGPGIHGTTTAAQDSPEWTSLEEAVENFGFDLRMVTQDGVTITPIEMALKGTLPWPQMYDSMTRAITILWRGGNLMSDSGGAPDQAGVTLQGEEADVLEQDDAEMIGDAINDYIVTPLLRYRFGEEPLAWVEWRTGARPDIKAAIEVDRFLAERGWQFSQEDLSERYGRTPPQDDHTILVPPAPAAAAMPGFIPASNSAATQRAAESVHADLTAAASNAYAEAMQADFLPVAERLQAISTMTDPAEAEVALRKLRADLPALLKALNAAPAQAAALEQALTAALFNGAAEGAGEREVPA